jgi:subtilisin family serine protease
MGTDPRGVSVPRSRFDQLQLVGLEPLMTISTGSSAITIALIDGAASYPALSVTDMDFVVEDERPRSAIDHATFIAGIISGARAGWSPSISPGCKLLNFAIFADAASTPSITNINALAHAIGEAVDCGAHIINLSLAAGEPSTRNYSHLSHALDYAARKETLIIAASGNQGLMGSTPVTRHPWVIPVAACDDFGSPLPSNNLCASVSRQGLCAPGRDVLSTRARGGYWRSSGSSAAAAFVSGAAGLLWSIHPGAPGSRIKAALRPADARRGLVPPVLDAWLSLLRLDHSNYRSTAGRP